MATSLLDKLQFKGQSVVLVANAPAEFEPHLRAFQAVTSVETGAGGPKRCGLALFFAT